MKIVADFDPLDQVLRRFGLKPVPFQLPSLRLPPLGSSPIFEQEVDPGDLGRGEDGVFLSPKGDTVFLYIDRFASKYTAIEDAIRDPAKLRKFHLKDCQTLLKMRAESRFERYVATDRHDSPFNITLNLKGQKPQPARARLHVCKNCITEVNWKNARGSNYETRNCIVESFSREEFLKAYNPSFSSRPQRDAWSTTIVDYPENWPEISRAIRRARGFRCEDPVCRVDCSSRPGLTDAHHLNHDVTDCRPENLQVLCKLCHEQRHLGWYHVRDRERRDIMELRREQGMREQGIRC